MSRNPSVRTVYKQHIEILSITVPGQYQTPGIKLIENNTLYGIRFQISSGSLGLSEFQIETKGDSAISAYEKVYPFDSTESLVFYDIQGVLVCDVVFVHPLKVIPGSRVVIKINTTGSITPSTDLSIALNYVQEASI